MFALTEQPRPPILPPKSLGPLCDYLAPPPKSLGLCHTLCDYLGDFERFECFEQRFKRFRHSLGLVAWRSDSS